MKTQNPFGSTHSRLGDIVQRRLPRHLMVITLAVDEPQLEDCMRILAAQRDVDFDHEMIRGLPNLEAHQRLYQTIQERSEDFDLFIKLDADMVLKNDRILSDIASWFLERPSVDHATFSVDDFFTGRPILGLHAYSHRARWLPIADRVFVDPAPTVPGVSAIVRGGPAPVADHAPDPSLEQAVSFGIHRAQKAVQPQRKGHVRATQARDQWEILLDVWRHYRRTLDPRLGHALLAARRVVEGSPQAALEGYRSATARGVVDTTLSDVDLKDEVRSFWGSRFRRSRMRFGRLGPGGTVRVAVASALASLSSVRGTRTYR